MTDPVRINRALISVSDKTGLLPLVNTLVDFGCEIISTGGTASYLAEHGIPITRISEVTGNPEAFHGRMKTISFNIASALLFDRKRDAEEAIALGIKPIDMVVCNLYPFEEYSNKIDTPSELIEYIDIGGPTMLRAAAKNFISVASVCNPHRYPSIITELVEQGGALSLTTRKYLMAEVFSHTAEYDSRIAETTKSIVGEKQINLRLEQVMVPRYGENSHQNAQFYRIVNKKPSLSDITVHGGIELSYNNILDLYSAVETVESLEQQGCVIIKHNNPCGFAQGNDQRKVFEYAWDCDTVSAFGGVVAFNSEVTLETIEHLNYHLPEKSAHKFIELVAAPGFSKEALGYLGSRKKIRVVSYTPEMIEQDKDIKIFGNSALIQTKDKMLYKELTCVTAKTLDIASVTPLIEFGIKSVKAMKSNAISLVRKTDDGCYQVVGKGIGQPNRVNSVQLCLDLAKKVLHTNTLAEFPNLILISDAFFPFEDNIDFAKEAGITTIVQPGGSIRDRQVIERCNEYGICMIFSSLRHFKH